MHVQKLSEDVSKLAAEISRKAASVPRPVRTAVLRHIAELGQPPDWETDAERLTWWAAMLLGVKDAEKVQVCPLLHMLHTAFAWFAHLSVLA
jgi:hypothetical protein